MSHMPAIEQWAIILPILGVIVGGIWLYVKFNPPKPWPPPGPRGWPADAQAGAEFIPLPGGAWRGAIGVGDRFNRCYWACSDIHRSPDEASACAHNQRANYLWNGEERTLTGWKRSRY